MPGSGDDVTINTTAAAIITIQAGDSESVHSLTAASNDTLSISGGALTIAANSTLSGLLSMTGGTATFNGTTSVGALNLTNGMLDGTGHLTVSAAMTWSGGTMSGSGSTTVQGAFVLGSADGNTHAEILDGRTLTVQGTMIESGFGKLSTLDQPHLVLPPSAPLSVPSARVRIRSLTRILS